ncbi:LysR family transcriptional regulator [Heyndrickxia ginsengihumi]|uniref:Transcriptional regulator n=1 Tax=Heyndrickxia ginsengihumi TaxID=363870 RepID=A0A0A6VB32_9BACI|nr:LysR family transcriptional regulator [Heyndrickxia ginsengihumi]KHD85460.1 transcriptional regulator [Heyndrickxia ginsengihumi]MBE6185293.1 LysR family transcriptional regulator [Bacillus sp. (in: firmicutes)]MCM3023801.1 LysR family transcriptional regulator [Heyndrickxia ginsengihumi]NEY19939.1 LysR family transcriptional regulator [Heyndrickxia ginsengihumi]
MDIRQLRYYCTIIEEKQITKAAKILHMAQPPLSHQLKLLEEELDVTLVHREGKKWEVTEEGKILYKRAKHLLQGLEETKREIAEVKEGIRGTISIGTSSICISHLAEHLSSFHKEFPDVYIKMWHGDTHYLEELLQQNKIDIALLLLPVEETNYETIHLKDDPFVVVVPRQWESKFSGTTISIEEASKYDLLLGRRISGKGMYDHIINAFHQHNVHPNIVLDCPEISTILTLVATGMGITIIPRSEIHQVYEEKLKVLQFSDPFLDTQPAVVWLKDKYLSKAAKELIKKLRDKQSAH